MTLNDWIDFLTKNSGPLALVVSAGTAANRYRQSRTFAPRLEISVTGQILKSNGKTYLQVRTKAKNFGQSSISIIPDGSYIKIFTAEENDLPTSAIEFVELDIYDVFKSHDWLESGETIEDLLLAKMPHDNFLAFNIEVCVNSPKNQWTQNAIINCKLKPDEPNSS